MSTPKGGPKMFKSMDPNIPQNMDRPGGGSKFVMTGQTLLKLQVCRISPKTCRQLEAIYMSICNDSAYGDNTKRLDSDLDLNSIH